MVVDGSSAGAAVVGDGCEVLIWGIFGGASDNRLPSPQVFQPAVPVVSASCGGGLCAFVTADQNLYLMDLGRTLGEPCGSPRLVEVFRREEVRSVSCGPSHVIAVTAGGRAYAVTDPDLGIVDGRGARLAAQGTLRSLELPLPAVHVSCGDSHVLLTTSSGGLFAFGDGHNGQLGLGELGRKSIPVPTCVRALAHLHVVEAAAGCTHSCATTTIGKLYSWGSNQHGQLGDGTVVSKSTPSLIAGLESVKAVAACVATAALCSDGSTFAWGFAGRHAPKPMFEKAARRIALSRRIFCAIGLDGELLFRAIDASAGRVVLAENNVVEVAAATGHIVAMTGKQVPKAANAAAAVQTSPSQPTVSGVEPLSEKANDVACSDEGAPSAQGADLAEVSELEGANHSLRLKLDEMKAEHFLDAAHLHGVLEAVDARSMHAGAVLKRRQADSVQLDERKQELELRKELATLREELRHMMATSESESGKASELNSAKASASEAAIAVQEKHMQLSLEHERLCAEREGLQANIWSVRSELSGSGQCLRRIEDACVSTQVKLEKWHARVAAMRQAAERLEEGLRSTKEECAHASAIHSEHEIIAGKRAELCAERSKLESALQEMSLDNCTSSAEAEDELLVELRSLTQEHHVAERHLAEQLGQSARLEGELAGIRHEFSSSRRQARYLEEESAAAERDARSLADDALFECNTLRTELDSSGAEAVTELRKQLAASEQERSKLRDGIRHRALCFSEEMSPLYEKVQRLHMEISSCGRAK
eukprot:gnl/TRDRNA2_/TRDRNA2_186443_c0_seq1.p1 gnl/TRDRNA2_/TRDRNA2_186443_c0~~gnl/TRDRNA2_/TRDRNA2_186443_c0_seq1.p1  ORF type:complete len:767 (+),score=156.18 gnl/TRDRNA2_/TRDRNA2_186443_c0_seq1:77-2377(+)